MTRPTLEQVAARAGVSRATVSRVVNDAPGVSAAVREAVRRTIAELGYIPNLAARSLVTRRTGSVAFVVTQRPECLYGGDAYFNGIVRGAAAELDTADQQLVLMFNETPASSQRVRRYVAGGHVDAVMLLTATGSDPLPDALVSSGIPVTCCERSLGPTKIPYVDPGNVTAAKTAVRHLVRTGRRRIATIAGPQDTSPGIDRLNGYLAELTETDRPSIVAADAFSRESGEAAMARLLADNPELDGLFAASDALAMGALAVLKAAGRRVPEDVAVVGFDDFGPAKHFDPPLTTVRQNTEELGRQLARMTLDLLAGEFLLEPRYVSSELVVRGSA